MRARDLVRESWDALRGSRMRTLLTSLGVTVGALALALIISLSLGLGRVVDDLVSGEEQLRQVFVAPGFGRRVNGNEPPRIEGEMSADKRLRLQRALKKRSRGGPPIQMATVLLDEEIEGELTALPEVALARPFIQDRYQTVLLANGDDGDTEPRRTLALGVPADHPYYATRLLAGRWFESDDERAVVVHELLLYQLGYTSDEAQAALLGRTLRLAAEKGSSTARLMQMWSGRDAGRPGDPLFVEELPIIGVMQERFGTQRSSVIEEGWAMQTDLFIPEGLARELWRRRPGRPGLGAMLLVARDLEGVERIEEAARDRGLQVRSVREVVSRVKQTLSMATVIAGFLAGIAIFVSTLGIVNTMVMSVMERTREIGLLKALGARSRDIALLFLTEGALIGLFGGVVGVAAALGLGAIGDEIGRARIEASFMLPFQGTLFPFPPWLIVGGIGFAMVTSLIASVLPALRAARIDPVRALRHE